MKTYLEKIGKTLKTAFYPFIHVGYYLEAAWQQFRDKDYIGRYVHPMTKIESDTFGYGDDIVSGMTSSARIVIYIPVKIYNLVETTMFLLDHEILHQVLHERISWEASEGLDLIQDGSFRWFGKKLVFKMWWKWQPSNG